MYISLHCIAELIRTGKQVVRKARSNWSPKVPAVHHHRSPSSVHETLTEYSTCPTTGESVVKGYIATFGLALVMQPSRVDLPAFGYPTSPISAIVRSSKR